VFARVSKKVIHHSFSTPIIELPVLSVLLTRLHVVITKKSTI